MQKPDPNRACITCNKLLPVLAYHGNYKICHDCAALPPNDIAILTKKTCDVLTLYATQSAAGRKAARRQAKIADYATIGKRCTSCHGHKPPGAFNSCAPRADGLQPICRACDEMQRTLIRAGNRPQWYIVRDAMRAANDEKPT